MQINKTQLHVQHYFTAEELDQVRSWLHTIGLIPGAFDHGSAHPTFVHNLWYSIGCNANLRFVDRNMEVFTYIPETDTIVLDQNYFKNVALNSNNKMAELVIALLVDIHQQLTGLHVKRNKRALYANIGASKHATAFGNLLTTTHNLTMEPQYLENGYLLTRDHTGVKWYNDDDFLLATATPNGLLIPGPTLSVDNYADNICRLIKEQRPNVLAIREKLLSVVKQFDTHMEGLWKKRKQCGKHLLRKGQLLFSPDYSTHVTMVGDIAVEIGNDRIYCTVGYDGRLHAVTWYENKTKSDIDALVLDQFRKDPTTLIKLVNAVSAAIEQLMEKQIDMVSKEILSKEDLMVYGLPRFRVPMMYIKYMDLYANGYHASFAEFVKKHRTI